MEYQQRQYTKNKFGRYAEIGTGKTLVDYLKEERFDAKEEMMNNLRQLFPEKPEEEEYWKQMTPDEIRELSRSEFVTIGSHGYYHNRMDKLSLDEASKEMADSKNYLQHLIGKEIKAFAFPYGNYSRDMVKEAKKLGFTQLLAMDFSYPEDENDDSMRERLTVNPFLSTNNQMYATIAGRYE